MSKATKYRDMAVSELEAMLKDLSNELYTLNNEMRRAKKTENIGQIRTKKKDKARLLTILHEKQLMISNK